MVFSSVTFIFVFLPITLALYFLSAAFLPAKVKFKVLNIILLFCSLFFYAWGEPSYILLLIVSMYGNFFIATAIDVNKGTRNCGVWLFTGCLLYTSDAADD